jgi:hypothetical protein
MLELDVAGLATISEAGVQIEHAPEGIIFAPLTEEHERLYSLIGWDEKFAAHNAALWQHGLLVVVPKGVEIEKPLYVRVTSSEDGGSLFWVIKGVVGCRQPILDVKTLGEGKTSRCEITLEPRVIRTAPQARRPFQGWRYLEGKDAPTDLTTVEATDLPGDLVQELRELGAW